MKSNPIILTASIAAALVVSACDRQKSAESSLPPSVDMQPVAKTKTFETARLEASIDTFDKEPTTAHDAEVKKAFAELDGEIAELQERVAKTSGTEREEAASKLNNLQSYRMAQSLRYTKVQAASGLGMPAADGRSAGQKIEDGAKKVGDSIEHAGEKTGDAIKDLAN